MLDAARFPTLSAYLAALPEGLASYPACRTKGAIVRSVLDEGDLVTQAPHLPEELAALVRDRPPLTAWIAAVHADAVFHLYCDTHAPSDQAMLDWTYERSTRFGRSQTYRHIFNAAGPRMLLRTGVRMHGFFQMGTELEVPELTAGSAKVVLKHPPHLHSRLNQLSNVALLRAIVDLTGGSNGKSEMVEHTPTHARYVVTWA
ncbi:MAG: hypothetical protein J0L92_20075 [Deltaproteobacteria bacterium]|nr:hypothetical protein [Deltaproteobacteria bacterium]